MDKDFMFLASKELSNADEQASAAIPDTGLKKNLNVNGHANGNGNGYRPPSAASSMRSEDMVTAEVGSIHNVVIDLGDEGPDAVPRILTDGKESGGAKGMGHATHLQAVRHGVEHEFVPGSPREDDRAHERDLPDGPRGDDEDPESTRDQEGATGRGAGQHEERLSADLVDGQADDEYHYRPSQEFDDGEPRALMHTDVAPREVDELGRETIAMPGVHPQEPPGPQNNIELTPRVVHLQVS
jgi:hypothetical protein